MNESDSLNFDELKRCSLFGGVTEEAFERIRPQIRVMHFHGGENIVTENCVNDRIYFVQHGSVAVLKTTHIGKREKEQLITTMHEGDTFGEMELIDIQPCAATVRALEETTTLSLSNHDLYQVSREDMKTFALLVMNLAREISRRLRHMDALLSEKPDAFNV
jgi:CRP/FNR family cyclic AMP-dependent transcriptional regulator